MADLEFKVAKRRRDPITFTLGDEREFTFNPPKSAVMMMPVLDADEDVSEVALTKATFDWLSQGLSEEDSKHIEDRLRDPEDDLDIDTLAEVIQGLSKKVGGNRPST